jgi:hypothetical protein
MDLRDEDNRMNLKIEFDWSVASPGDFRDKQADQIAEHCR